MSTILHQIYYREDQKSKLFDFATPYFNTGLTIFFENTCIADIVMKSEAEKTAVASWKLKQKMRRGHNLTQKVLESDYQVLNFITHSHRHAMMAMSANWHKGFLPAIDLLWQKLGYKRPVEAKNPIYQNHFSSKTEIYKDYVSTFLIPAMDLILKDEELNTLMMADSNYGRLSRDADLKSVKAKLNLDIYPLAPFVLERCPSLFFQMKGYRITNVPADL